MWRPARSSICAGQRRPGEQPGDVKGHGGERRTTSSCSVTGCSAPMRSNATVPAGMGAAWLFCSHNTTRSSSRGAGSPA